MEMPQDPSDASSLYSLTNDLIHSDPSVKYYIITNLDRFMKTVGPDERKDQLLNQITSKEFITDIIGYTELVFEYVKKIISLSNQSQSKLKYLNALEAVCTDTLDYFIIEHIEGGILTILSEMSEELPQQCARVMKEFNESKVVAKQSLIPSIISQFYSMLSQEAQESYLEIFHNLAQQGVPLIKRKICQNLHEGGYLGNEETMTMLEQFIKDPNE